MSDHDEDEMGMDEAELARLRERVLQAGIDGTQLTAPPPEVWTMIETEIARHQSIEPSRPRLDVVATLPRRWLIPAAAAALVAVVVGTIAVVTSGRESTSELATVTLSNDGLDPTGAELTGAAALVERNGALTVELDLPELPDVEGYYEVWVIDTDVVGMHSLGSYHGDGEYRLPAGVDIAEFPIIDVSIELADGQPAHSGVSILRGVAVF